MPCPGARPLPPVTLPASSRHACRPTLARCRPGGGGGGQDSLKANLMTDRERLSKVLAIAINPGSYEQEAVAALRRARELVKLDPTLAHPPPAPPEPAQLPSAGEHSVETKVVSIPP